MAIRRRASGESAMLVRLIRERQRAAAGDAAGPGGGPPTTPLVPSPWQPFHSGPLCRSLAAKGLRTAPPHRVPARHVAIHKSCALVPVNMLKHSQKRALAAAGASARGAGTGGGAEGPLPGTASSADCRSRTRRSRGPLRVVEDGCDAACSGERPSAPTRPGDWTPTRTPTRAYPSRRAKSIRGSMATYARSLTTFRSRPTSV